MEYDYEKLNSLFNLQRTEIERVLAEARQALESLTRNQHLLNQHQRLTMRLNEIKTQLALTASRVDELKLNQRIANIELEALNAELKDEPAEAGLEDAKQAPVAEWQGAADGGGASYFSGSAAQAAPASGLATSGAQNRMEYLSQLSREIELEWKKQRQTELSGQLRVFRLKLVELLNQKTRLENHREAFVAELNKLEQQLQTNAIGANQLPHL